MLKPFINKIKLKRSTNIWKITDQIICIKDVTDHAIPDFSSRYKNIDGYSTMKKAELIDALK